MKKLLSVIVLLIVFAAASTLVLNAQRGMHGMMGLQDPEYYDYPSRHQGMMGYGMMGYGMFMGGMGCPTMMNYLRGVDYYLSFQDELGLSGNQVDQLEQIRETYQKKAIEKSSNLMEKTFELNTLLRKDEIDLSKLKKVNKEIEEIQTELRYNNLEGYVNARKILTDNQLNQLRTHWFKGYPGKRPGTMR